MSYTARKTNTNMETEGVVESKRKFSIWWNYKKCKRLVYLFLERPETKSAMIYHISSFALILGSLTVSVLSTLNEFEDNDVIIKVILVYELTLLSIFITEFCLRLWSCSYISRFQGFRGRLRFMKSFYMMVDAFVITSTLVTAILQINASYFTILRITRFMQILRILRIDRQRGDLQFMVNVVRQHSKELVTCYFVGFILLFSGSYLVYICEKLSDDDSRISNMADGLYWAMITVTSVGYGDFSPKTWPGKFVSGIFALIGCAFFALPAGIIGSGFALQVDKQKKEKRFVKVRHPAALVLQTFWRNYATQKSNSGPTWFYLLPQLQGSGLVASSNKELSSLNDLMRVEFSKKLKGTNEMPGTFYYNPSIAGKKPEMLNLPKALPTKEKGRSELQQVLSKEELMIPAYCQAHGNATKCCIPACLKGSEETVITPKYRIAIRLIMKMKCWLVVKKFKTTRYPFINMQDIVEKASQNHVDLLTAIKEMKDSFEKVQQELHVMKVIVQNLQVSNLESRNKAEIVSDNPKSSG